jgi:hypothetical protein
LQSPPHWPGVLQPVRLVKGSAYQFSGSEVLPGEVTARSSNSIVANSYFPTIRAKVYPYYYKFQERINQKATENLATWTAFNHLNAPDSFSENRGGGTIVGPTIVSLGLPASLGKSHLA